jgi:peptide/nickel transport system permease protein
MTGNPTDNTTGNATGNTLVLRLGAILVALLAVAALLAPWIAPYGPDEQDIVARLSDPALGHLLGTDNFGRDVLARILFGLRTLFAVSCVSVLGALLVGGSVGLIAAWRGGMLDRVAMRVADVLFAFPIILLAIGVISLLRPGTLSATVAIGIAYTPIFARTLRAPALLLRNSDFVLAARAVGAGGVRIVLRHLLPNLAAIVLVQTSLSLSTAMLVEASLSFLGLGTQPPTPSLGRMLAESRNFVMLSPWPAAFSGLAILLASLGFNLLGDGLQERLDPRLRGT